MAEIIEELCPECLVNEIVSTLKVIFTDDDQMIFECPICCRRYSVEELEEIYTVKK